MLRKRLRLTSLITGCIGCILCIACGQSSVENHIEDVSISESDSQGTQTVLTGADLKVWSKVDTTGKNAEVLKVLRTFFDDKLKRQEAGEQAFWVSEDFEQFRREYAEICYAEYDFDRVVKYWPTLLSIDKVEGHRDHHFATVRWASLDSLDSTNEVRFVFKFLVKPDWNDEVRLSAPTKVLTADWRREKVGDVIFVLSPKHEFSRKQAEQQQEAIEEMVEFFEVESFPITFYSFRHATELLQIRGYILHPMFYKFETGGQAGVGDVVYSGNDRDEYVHEVVHLFITRRIPNSKGLLNEGLATLIGGSSGHPYEWQKAKLKSWLLAHPDADLTKHLNPYQSQYIEEDTSIAYLIGAMLCDKILEDHGKEVLFEALAEGNDPWTFLDGLGINKDELREVLLGVN